MKLLLLVSILILGGCGLIKDRSSEYTNAQVGTQITIPKHLSDLKVNSRYPVSPIEYEGRFDEDYELPKPPNTTATQTGGAYVVEEADGQKWLSLYMAPGRVWPLIDFFLSDHDIEVVSETIKQGALETGAISSSSSLFALLDEDAAQVLDGKSISLQLRQGVRRRTSEIVVVVNGLSSSNQQGGAGKELDVEADLLNVLGEFVTSDEQQNRQSLLANNISSEPKVFLINNDSGSYLKFDLSHERTWIEVKEALDGSGAIVSDVNRSEGKIFISYLDEDEVSSWFSTKTSEAEKRKETNFVVVLGHSSENEEPYMIVNVELLNDKFESERILELLQLIYEHVS